MDAHHASVNDTLPGSGTIADPGRRCLESTGVPLANRAPAAARPFVPARTRDDGLASHSICDHFLAVATNDPVGLRPRSRRPGKFRPIPGSRSALPRACWRILGSNASRSLLGPDGTTGTFSNDGDPLPWGGSAARACEPCARLARRTRVEGCATCGDRAAQGHNVAWVQLKVQVSEGHSASVSRGGRNLAPAAAPRVGNDSARIVSRLRAMVFLIVFRMIDALLCASWSRRRSSWRIARRCKMRNTFKGLAVRLYRVAPCPHQLARRGTSICPSNEVQGAQVKARSCGPLVGPGRDRRGNDRMRSERHRSDLRRRAP